MRMHNNQSYTIGSPEYIALWHKVRSDLGLVFYVPDKNYVWKSIDKEYEVPCQRDDIIEFIDKTLKQNINGWLKACSMYWHPLPPFQPSDDARVLMGLLMSSCCKICVSVDPHPEGGDWVFCGSCNCWIHSVCVGSTTSVVECPQCISFMNDDFEFDDEN